MSTFDELEFDLLQLDQHGPLAIISLPKRSGFLTGELLQELLSAAEEVQNSDCDALILTAEADFPLGLDPAELGELEGALEARAHSQAGQEALEAIAALPLPTIACISGRAEGAGLELALSCDFRVLSSQGTLSMNGISQGLPPCLGGSQRLLRLLGPSRALDLLLSGRDVPAQEALDLGLVNRVSDNPLQSAREMAESMAAQPPLVVSLIKEGLRRGVGTNFENALEIESDLFAVAASDGEFKRLLKATKRDRGPRR